MLSTFINIISFIRRWMWDEKNCAVISAEIRLLISNIRAVCKCMHVRHNQRNRNRKRNAIDFGGSMMFARCTLNLMLSQADWNAKWAHTRKNSLLFRPLALFSSQLFVEHVSLCLRWDKTKLKQFRLGISAIDARRTKSVCTLFGGKINNNQFYHHSHNSVTLVPFRFQLSLTCTRVPKTR